MKDEVLHGIRGFMQKEIAVCRNLRCALRKLQPGLARRLLGAEKTGGDMGEGRAQQEQAGESKPSPAMRNIEEQAEKTH